MTGAIIGGRIKEVRKMRKLTQSELAKMIEVHRNTVTDYELGIMVPSVRTFAKLAYTLKVPADYLMGLTESTHEKTGLNPLFDKIEKMGPRDTDLIEDSGLFFRALILSSP